MVTYGWNTRFKTSINTVNRSDFLDIFTSSYTSSTQNTFNTLFPTKSAKNSTTYTREFDRPNLRSMSDRLGGSAMDT